MASANASIRELTNRPYKWGFHSTLESDSVRPGLGEDVIEMIVAANFISQPFDLTFRIRRHDLGLWKSAHPPHHHAGDQVQLFGAGIRQMNSAVSFPVLQN